MMDDVKAGRALVEALLENLTIGGTGAQQLRAFLTHVDALAARVEELEWTDAVRNALDEANVELVAKLAAAEAAIARVKACQRHDVVIATSEVDGWQFIERVQSKTGDNLDAADVLNALQEVSGAR